jgi:hypothetical protein
LFHDENFNCHWRGVVRHRFLQPDLLTANLAQVSDEHLSKRPFAK